MNRLAMDDIEFYSDPRNWRGGPMYQVRLVYARDFPQDDITEAAVNLAGLIVWHPRPGAEDGQIKSILRIDSLKSVGFAHTYQLLSDKSAEYSLSIYPEQFCRVVGKKVDEGWESMEAARLMLLHDALLLLIFQMKEETPLKCASICAESSVHVEPEDCGRSICLCRILAKTLDLPFSNLSQLDYFGVIALDN